MPISIESPGYPMRYFHLLLPLFILDMLCAIKETVQVVLNSLSHDDYIPKSLGFLRKGGRFMEIGNLVLFQI